MKHALLSPSILAADFYHLGCEFALLLVGDRAEVHGAGHVAAIVLPEQAHVHDDGVAVAEYPYCRFDSFASTNGSYSVGRDGALIAEHHVETACRKANVEVEQRQRVAGSGIGVQGEVASGVVDERHLADVTQRVVGGHRYGLVSGDGVGRSRSIPIIVEA